ncbi:uncharacterized protein [Prorops nasuta]|uniref:uncharacterized protein n=1 Tax=Prorops nasuta TaxID=863751 RepID=UPI0034CFE399
MHFRLGRDVTYEIIRQFETSEIFRNLLNPAGKQTISAEKHIFVYLWFVGHYCCSFRDVSDRFNISISSLHKIIIRVTDFLLSISPRLIHFPNQEEKQIIKEYFLNKKGFPNVIGAIDGSHIRIDRPADDPNAYMNRKQYFSLHIQGVVNHDTKFLDVFVGFPGSVHDSRVLKESTLFGSLEEICGDNDIILGDSAYPCLKNLIVPYKDNGHLTARQREFNKKLSSCRVVIENAFGRLKQRFRQLDHLKLKCIIQMVKIIHVCCVLHNIANCNDITMFEPPLPEDNIDIEARNETPLADNENVVNSRIGRNLRDILCLQIT